jgi:hypothetical protein
MANPKKIAIVTNLKIRRASLHNETKLKMANFASEDRYANPYVERMATAMLKLRNQAR